MYYGLVREPEGQLPGLISAYVQVGGERRGRRDGTGSGEAGCAGGGSLEDRVGWGQGWWRVVPMRVIVRPLRRRQGQGVRPAGRKEA